VPLYFFSEDHIGNGRATVMLPKSLMNSRRLMGFISVPRTTFLKFSPIFKRELCAASQRHRRVHEFFPGLIQFCLDQGLREDETCLWGLPAVREDIP
ncbi:MAG: hypothetical protein WA703_04830, partial [Pseudolabrys sp.]